MEVENVKRMAHRDVAPYKKLVEGDAYTFITESVTPFYVGDTETPVGPGDFISKWFATNEPGRVFLVQRVGKLKSGQHTYETVYKGFLEVVSPSV